MLTSFEHKLSENPHNNNIKASTKDAYFKYFDGERWIKCPKWQFFDVVITKRVQQLKEAFDRLEGVMTEFTKDQVSDMIGKLEEFTSVCPHWLSTESRDTKDMVNKGILDAEKQRSRLAHIEKSIGRRIESVGKDTSEQHVVRDSTWEGLETMRESG